MTNELILQPSLSIPLLSLLFHSLLFTMVRVKEQTKSRRDKHRSKTGGKQARKQLATKAARRSGNSRGVEKRPHRWRPGTVALRTIRHLQKDNTKPLIRAKPFRDIVQHVLTEHCRRPDYKGWRLSKETTDAIREYVETDNVKLMRAGMILACRNKKKTLDSNSINSVLAIEQITHS
jgi:histone H3